MKSEGENGGKRRFGQKIGTFWRRYILRKKPQEEPKSTSSSSSSMTREQKNKLAAEAATSGMRLDSKTREQVAKALAAEMQRRHMERERRRKELMERTQVNLPWGKKTPVRAKQVAKGTSPGAAVFPIKMELKAKAKAKVEPKKAFPKRGVGIAAEIEEVDEPQWQPVPAVAPASPAGSSLEDQRRAWLAKSSKDTPSSSSAKSSPVQPTSKASMPAGPPTWSPAPDLSPEVAQAFGSQPTELQIDDETAREIHSHTFEKMLENILMETKEKQMTEKQAKVEAPQPTPSKDPQDMTPEELVGLLQANTQLWDQYTRQNSVVSFGIVAPTDEDRDRGQKKKAVPKKAKVTFEPEIDVARVPVGKDFDVNETRDISTGTLKKL